MVDYKKKIVSGTLNVLLFMVLSIILGYTLKLILTRHMAVGDIGLFYSVLGFITFFVFLRDFGLSETLVYYIPRFIIDKKKKDIKASIVLTLSIQITIGVLFFLFVLLFLPILQTNYFKDPRAGILLICLSIYFIIDGFSETLYRIFHGYQNILLNQGIEFFFQLVTFILFLIFIYSNISIKYFGISYIIGSVLTTILFFYFFIKLLYKDFFLVKTNISKKLRDKMFRYSLPAMFGSIGVVLFSNQSIFFLTFFLGVESVGYYVMILSLAKITSYLFSAMKQVFLPMVSELWKRRKTKELKNIYNKLITWTYIFAIPLSLILFYFPEEIIKLIYSEKFLLASSLLKLQSIYFLIIMLNLIIRNLFFNMGFPEKSRNIIFFTLIVNLILNFIFIPTLGLIGAGVADLISAVASSLFAIYLQKKYLPIQLEYTNLIKIIFAGIFFITSLLFLKNTLHMETYIKVIIALLSSSLVYFLTLLSLKIITYDEIKKLVKQISGILFKQKNNYF